MFQKHFGVRGGYCETNTISLGSDKRQSSDKSHTEFFTVICDSNKFLAQIFMTRLTKCFSAPVNFRRAQLLNALFTFLLSVQLLSLWRELQDALIGWRWTCQLLPQSCAAQTCISGIFVVNPLKLGVGGDLPKIRIWTKKCVQKVRKYLFSVHIYRTFHIYRTKQNL